MDPINTASLVPVVVVVRAVHVPGQALRGERLQAHHAHAARGVVARLEGTRRGEEKAPVS